MDYDSRRWGPAPEVKSEPETTEEPSEEIDIPQEPEEEQAEAVAPEVAEDPPAEEEATKGVKPATLTIDDLELITTAKWRYDVIIKATGKLLLDRYVVNHAGGGYYEVEDLKTRKPITKRISKNKALEYMLSLRA